MRKSINVFLLVICALAVPTHLMATVIAPIGLAPGSEYQLVFVTADNTYATSGDITQYNTFVSNEAALSPSLPSGVTWDAVVSTATVSAITNAPSNGLPIYNTAGIEVATGETGLYTPTLLSNIEFNQYGIANAAEDPWTGTDYTGIASSYPMGASSTSWGDSYTTLPIWMNENEPSPSNFEELPLYALSSPITVPTPEPSSLVLLGLGAASMFLVGRRNAGPNRDS